MPKSMLFDILKSTWIGWFRTVHELKNTRSALRKLHRGYFDSQNKLLKVYTIWFINCFFLLFLLYLNYSIEGFYELELFCDWSVYVLLDALENSISASKIVNGISLTVMLVEAFKWKLTFFQGIKWTLSCAQTGLHSS